MKIENSIRAEILTQALPYIREYTGKTIVVKYGGNAMINDDLKRAVIGDCVLLQSIGVKVVLVHGGGPEISGFMDKVGKDPEFVDGLRVTDRETAELAQMVLAGKIGKQIVSLINSMGGKAVSLSGVDADLITAEKLDAVHGYVGNVTSVNSEIVNMFLDNGIIPVISPVGADKDGNIYNINADNAAAAVAGSLKAQSLINLSDIPGLLRDRNDPDSLIKKLYVSDAPELVREGVITGGMIPKIQCCTEAIRRGVKRVFIMDGRIPHAILLETLTDEGLGTMFVA